MHSPNPKKPTENLRALFESDDRPKDEIRQMIRLMQLLADLPNPPDPFALFPDYDRLKRRFLEAAKDNDPDLAEERFLELYCHLHGAEAPYTETERRRVDETGGYWCHAGGLSPLLKAGPWIQEDTVSGDFGAGNGLQALLLQKLYPHAKTIQIEISSRMVQCGRHLQNWLGINDDRVEWIVGDVCDTRPDRMDFIYIYRPLKPVGEGIGFYERFAKTLSESNREVVIFSIADCLKDFLPPDFSIFYNDGHLTCFHRKPD